MEHVMQTLNKTLFFGLFNDSFPPIMDGVTLTVLNYAYHLDQKNLTPVVVTPKNPIACKAPYQMARYFSLPIRDRYPYRYGFPKLDFKIWSYLRRKPFAIVHSHSPFSAGRLALYAAKRQGIPLIGTFHSKYRTDLEHSFRHSPWMVNIIMRKIRKFYESCDEIWIPQAEVETTVREYGIKGRVRVMENGNDYVDLVGSNDLKAFKQQARRRLGLMDNEIGLLFVGQHIWEKGIDIIVEALQRLSPEVKFKMHFIGNGYAANDLQALIDRYGLSERVTLHGVIKEREELATYYAGCDLFLFPSFYDNAPLVVREAAALGTPSVLLRGSTASEVIKSSNGFLAECKPEEYAAIITNLYGNRRLMAETGLNARATLARSWQDVMDEVVERYAKIISDYKSPPHKIIGRI
jgi:glycosyltransferase involved in cell wall biosynthesis